MRIDRNCQSANQQDCITEVKEGEKLLGRNGKEASKDNPVHLFTNGIFNQVDDAVKYAQQMSGTEKKDANGNVIRDGNQNPIIDYSVKPDVMYVIYSPISTGLFDELVVAAYAQAGSPLGLTAAEEGLANIIAENPYLDVVAHSRGSFTLTNAQRELLRRKQEEDAKFDLSNLEVTFYGAAQNLEEANKIHQELLGDKKAQIASHLNKYDPIGMLHKNPKNEGITRDISIFTRFKDTFIGDSSSHNCYASGDINCGPHENKKGELVPGYYTKAEIDANIPKVSPLILDKERYPNPIDPRLPVPEIRQINLPSNDFTISDFSSSSNPVSDREQQLNNIINQSK
jgi:hypothetical protein